MRKKIGSLDAWYHPSEGAPTRLGRLGVSAKGKIALEVDDQSLLHTLSPLMLSPREHQVIYPAYDLTFSQRMIGQSMPVLGSFNPNRKVLMQFAAEYDVRNADTRLPANGIANITKTIAAGAVGGGFARHFDHPSSFLRITCNLASWRGRSFGWFLGDQAMFIRRDVFEELEGFHEMDCFEDLDLSRRMSHMGKTKLISSGVVSSGRRFQKRGAAWQTIYDFYLTLKYLASQFGSQVVASIPTVLSELPKTKRHSNLCSVLVCTLT